MDGGSPFTSKKVFIPNNWKPRKYQRKAWKALERGCKRVLLVWHRRAGKDDVCLHFAATQVVKTVGNYWHCLPKYNQARKAIWESVNKHTGMRRIDEAFPKEIIKRKREDQMMIEFKNGSTWKVVGADNPDSLVGTGVAGITFSEFALSNPTSWAILKPIFEENDGYVLFISTPRGKNHYYRMFNEYQNDPDWFVQKLSIEDTQMFDEARIEKIKQGYIKDYGEDFGESVFQQEYLCSFDAAILGAYYAKELQKAEKEGRITSVPYDPMYPVSTVWDLGYSDDTVILFYQVVAGEYRIIDHYETNGQTLSHYADYLRLKPYKYDRHWLPHDAQARTLQSSGKSAIEILQENGIRDISVVFRNSEQQGIIAVRQIFPKLWIDKAKCNVFLEAISQFQREWNDDKKCFGDNPKHDWTNHSADALRYLAWVIKDQVEGKKKEPPRFLSVGKESGFTFNDLIDLNKRR